MTDLVPHAPFPASAEAARDFFEWHVQNGRGGHLLAMDRRGVEYSLDTRRVFVGLGFPDDDKAYDSQHIFLRALPA